MGGECSCSHPLTLASYFFDNIILFFGPLADVIRVETIYLVSSAFLALTGVIYGLSEKKAGLQERY
jgi:hypothetical protein